jgi:hypothetical protein
VLVLLGIMPIDYTRMRNEQGHTVRMNIHSCPLLGTGTGEERIRLSITSPFRTCAAAMWLYHSAERAASRKEATINGVLKGHAYHALS